MRIIAISDIHGCLLSFRALLRKINYCKEDQLFILGDYVDRGPDSKGVIDLIWDLQQTGHSVVCLKGNHEEMLLKGIASAEYAPFWLLHGGKETLLSFGEGTAPDIPPNYLEWIRQLPHFYTHDRYVFVHGGLDFSHSDPLQATKAMLWQRNWYDQINFDWLQDQIIVHGHTPIEKDSIQSMLQHIEKDQVLDIDAGCVFGNYLCAFDVSNQQLFFQEKLEQNTWVQS